jgi:hypothetical protein
MSRIGFDAAFGVLPAAGSSICHRVGARFSLLHFCDAFKLEVLSGAK